MDSHDREQTRILQGMWNQLKELQHTLAGKIDQVRIELGTRIDATNERLDQTNERLDQTRADLGARIGETNARLDQTNARIEQTNARIEQTRDDLCREVRALRVATQHGFETVLETGERRYTDLDSRVTRLERRTGLRDD